jgi:hypothetical protein
VDWFAIPDHVKKFIDFPLLIISIAPLAAAVFFVVLVGASIFVFMTIAQFERCSEERQKRSGLFLALFSTTSMMAILLFTAGVFTDVFIVRYAFPLLWWPLVLCACGVTLVVRQSQQRELIANALFLTLTVAMISIFLSKGMHLPRILTWRDPLVACIKNLQRTEGLRSGLAEWDLAPYLSALSDYTIQVQQIAPNGSAVDWGYDPRWFVQSIQNPSRPPHFNFIIIAHPSTPIDPASPFLAPSARGPADFLGLPPQQIREAYGEPETVFSCPDLSEHMRRTWRTPIEIWRYNNDAAVFNTLITNGLPIQEVYVKKGAPICISPRLLFGGDFVTVDRTRTATVNADNGAASWGPYIALPRGRMMVRLVYSLRYEGGPLGKRSSWTVTANYGANTLYGGTLEETLDGFSEAMTSFKLEKDTAGIEVVTRLGGGGRLIIKAVEIAPIDSSIDPDVLLGPSYLAGLTTSCRPK